MQDRNKIRYGRNCYEAFAKGFAARHGVSVEVKPGSSPAVDQFGTLILPGMDTYQTEKEFQDTCASIIHEVAHVKFGSNEFMASAMAGHAGKDALYEGCLNTVLDIADEYAIGAWEIKHRQNRAVRERLDWANHRAYTDNKSAYDTPGTKPFHWQVQCAAIIDSAVSKSAGRHLVSRVELRKHGATLTPPVDVDLVINTARKARTVRTGKSTRQAQERRLHSLALDLAKLLEGCRQEAEDAQRQGQDTTPGVCGVATPGEGIPGKGEAALPGDCVLADAGAIQVWAQSSPGYTPRNVPVATTGQSPVSQSDTPGTGYAGGVGNGPTDVWQGRPRSESAYRMCLPSIKRLGNIIATDGYAWSQESGYSNGAMLGDMHRAVTDGHGFSRWQEPPNAEGVSVALLLDTSGSMSGVIQEVAGIGQAFLDGLQEGVTAQAWTYSDYPKQVASLHRVYHSGGTDTGEAVLIAGSWVNKRPGRRVMVVITDGQTAYPWKCHEAVTACRKAGVGVLAIGLGGGVYADELRDSMPGAEIIMAADPAAMSIELIKIARRL